MDRGPQLMRSAPSRVLLTGMGGELGSRVARLLEYRSEIARIVGVDFEPPRRRLTRAEFHRIGPHRSDRIKQVVRELDPTAIVHLGVYEPTPGPTRAPPHLPRSPLPDGVRRRPPGRRSNGCWCAGIEVLDGRGAPDLSHETAVPPLPAGSGVARRSRSWPRAALALHPVDRSTVRLVVVPHLQPLGRTCACRSCRARQTISVLAVNQRTRRRPSSPPPGRWAAPNVAPPFGHRRPVSSGGRLRFDRGPVVRAVRLRRAGSGADADHVPELLVRAVADGARCAACCR